MYTIASMRFVVVAGLALALFAPVLRAQPRANTLYATILDTKTGNLLKLYRTESDKECRVETYDDADLLFALGSEPVPSGDGVVSESCEASLSIKLLVHRLNSSARKQSGLALTSSPESYLWVLSDTAPDSAPATDDAVYAVDPNSLQIVATLLTPGPIPLALAGGNTGQYVYATIQGVAAGQTGIPAHPPLVEVISTSTLAITQTINLPQGANPGRPAPSPDDRYLYVPSNGTTSGLLVIDTENPSSITTIPVMKTFRSGPAAVPVNSAAITPDGELLFLIETSTSPADIYVIDTTTGQQIADLATGDQQLNDLVLDATGSRLYVAGQMTVYAYNTATLEQIGSVLTKTGVLLNNIGISSEGTMVFANDQNSTAVFVIDPVSLTVTEADLPAPPPFPSGESPTSIMVVQ